MLDQAGVEKYIASWLKAAGSAGKKAKIIGIHNYSQVNRRITEKKATNRYPGIARIIKAVRKKNKRRQVLVHRDRRPGELRRRLPVRQAAARRTARSSCSTCIKKYDKNVERLYSYNWFGNGCTPASTPASSRQTARRAPRTTTFKSELKNTTQVVASGCPGRARRICGARPGSRMA